MIRRFNTDDEEVARKIALKFRSPTARGVSFCNIAEKAEELGRKKLAILVHNFFLLTLK